MCLYQRAPECSAAMRTSRMCRACHLHQQKEIARLRRSGKASERPGKVSERPTLAELVAQHSGKPIYQVWV